MLYRLVVRLLGALVLVASIAPVSWAAVPFDSNLAVLPDSVRLPRWDGALRAIATDDGALDACLADPAACAGPRLRAWRDLVVGLAGVPAATQLRAVNDFVNAVPYAADMENYGVRDLWSGPWSFLQTRGDCEDYAIAKYATLKRLGFARRDLRLVVVEDLERNLAHAVLAVRQADGVWLLDNQIASPIPAETQKRYAPYYAVNEDSRWLHRLPGAASGGS